MRRLSSSRGDVARPRRSRIGRITLSIVFATGAVTGADAVLVGESVGWVFTEQADLKQAVRECTAFDQTGVTCEPPIGSWDVSAVTNMMDIFYDQQNFNADISGWNTSSVTDMYGMFVRAYEFNQPIGNWDVS